MCLRVWPPFSPVATKIKMMIIVFITFNLNRLVPLIDGLCSSNPWKLSSRVLDGIEPTA